MNFRKRELAFIKITIERDVVLHKTKDFNTTLVAYAHKDDELGNQVISVEVCNKTTGEFEKKQYNIPADVAYILETREILEVQQ
jgi:hypothetical protein